MKMSVAVLTVIYLLFCGGQATAELNQLEKKYLLEFGNYKGNLGLGFVPSHTYDYAFRQAIIKSKDETVQRAYILQRLPYEMKILLHTLEVGKMVAKDEYQPLTPKEQQVAISQFEEMLSLMQKLDAGKHKHFYEEYREELKKAVDAKKR